MLSTAVSFCTHPFMGLILEIIFSLATLMARPQRQPLFFGLAVISTYLALRGIASLEVDAMFGHALDDGPTDILIKTSMFMILNIGCLAFLENHTLRHRDTFLGRLHEAYKMLTNGRRIGTDRIAPQMPVLEEYTKPSGVEMEKFLLKKGKSGSQDTPAELRGQMVGTSFHDRLGTIRRESRRRFLLRRTALVLALYIAEYMIKPNFQYEFFPMYASDFDMHKISMIRRLHEVSRRELIMRAYLALETAWISFAFYTMAHSFGSIFFVGVFLDEPHEWPPLFGDIKQAYSMRRYWVKYYDRLIYRTMSGYGKLFLRCLGLGGHGSRKDKAWQRWLLNSLLFLESGLLHAHTSWLAGSTCGYWPEVWWWQLHFLAIALETCLQEILARMCPRLYQRLCGNWVGKAIGFFWVFFFLGWAAPKYSYSVYACERERLRAARATS